VDPKSGEFIEALAKVRPWYDWGNNYGLPYSTVSGNHPKVRFAGGSYWKESDDVGYPIPQKAMTEPGWTEELTETISDMPGKMDRHLLIVDVDNHQLYEIYQPFYNAGTTPVKWGNGKMVQPGEFYCASAATWDLSSNATRPDGWTSSSAAGLQVLPGLVQFDEVMGSKPIRHAHRMTLNGSAKASPRYVWPATHAAGSWSTVHPPLGARFRLKASTDISRFGPHAQKLLQSMKSYGLIFDDNGRNGLINGTNDARWGDYESPIRKEIGIALSTLSFADFEVVELGWK
jgi:hypothetical protein